MAPAEYFFRPEGIESLSLRPYLSKTLIIKHFMRPGWVVRDSVHQMEHGKLANRQARSLGVAASSRSLELGSISERRIVVELEINRNTTEAWNSEGYSSAVVELASR